VRPRAKLSTAIIFVIGCGSGPITQHGSSSPSPGVLIDVDGHKMHIRCVGPLDAKPTIILEAGGGDYSNRWSRVQELLSPRVRTCAYDRAGSGWSEPGPAPRTMKQEVFELHALLDNAKVSPPYVLVGHSIGGLLVRLYVERYGSDVVALVLVDPTHENGRIVQMKPGEPQRVVRLRDGSEEIQQIYLSRKANPEPLGNRPLIVLAAARPSPAPPGLSDDAWNELQRERPEQVADLARLSGNSKLVRDPSSGHRIHVDNPELVARAIEEVMTAALNGVRVRE
jgi:pimeloyl-ACP methyl ester carboxylesterase